MNKHPQKATLWRKAGFSPDGGGSSWTRIDTFDVRWEDSQTLRLAGFDRFTLSRSTVFFQDDVFKIGDMIAEGEFSEANPVVTAFEIKDKMRTPNLSGSEYEYKALV